MPCSLAQGHNEVMLVRLEPTTPQSRVKHSTTEPLELKFIILEVLKSHSLNSNGMWLHELS